MSVERDVQEFTVQPGDVQEFTGQPGDVQGFTGQLGDMQEFLVQPGQAGERLDRFLSDACGDYSRSFLQKLVKEGQVLVNQKAQKANYKVNEYDCITV